MSGLARVVDVNGYQAAHAGTTPHPAFCIGSHSLGWADRVESLGRFPRVRVYVLPRQRGESRVDYARRFFASIEGLGHVTLFVGRRRIGSRGW